ncbi:MAG: hypothetical protein R2824_10295 [Saprospiraceae bacterium]
MRPQTLYHITITLFLLILSLSLAAQISITPDNSDPAPSAMLDVQSTDKGMLAPRLTTAQRLAIPAPAFGLLVFDTDSEAFWFMDASGWQKIQSGSLLAPDILLSNDCYPDESLDTFYEDPTNADYDFNNNQWQSFTADKNGYLTNVEIKISVAQYVNCILRVYEGQGTSGTLLYEANIGNSGIHGWYGSTIPYESVAVSAGNEYTINFISPDDFGWYLREGNPYAGGRANYGVNADYQFRTYVSECTLRNVFDTPSSVGNINIQHIDTVFYGDGTYQASGIPFFLADTDGDTKIQVEESPDEDAIRFDLAGRQHMILRSNGAGFPILEFSSEKYSPLVSQYNMFFGKGAGINFASGDANTFFGNDAGHLQESGSYNVYLGYSAGRNNAMGDNNTFIGAGAGQTNTGSGNVFLGQQAGYSATGSNQLYIENSFSNAPLIYGEFDNDLLRINGTLDVNGAYQFPSTDGTADQVLQTDGAGNISWADKTSGLDNQTIDQLSLNGTTLEISLENDGQALQTVDLAPLNSTQNIIEDTDGDTKIQVEESPDEDIIRFDLNGLERARLDDTRLQLISGGEENLFIGFNTGNAGGSFNLFLGGGAGSLSAGTFGNVGVGFQSQTILTSGNENTALGLFSLQNNQGGTGNVAIGSKALQQANSSQNTAVGWESLKTNTLGSQNTALGSLSLRLNQSGRYNVALGAGALQNNTTGERNTAVGFNARASAPDLQNATAIGADALVSQSNSLVLGNAADVGIGISTPEAKLHVVGTTKLEGLLTINEAYSLPMADGLAGQVLATDGSGNVSWGDKTVDTDDQTIDQLSLNGTTLEISLEDDGQVTQTIDLAGIDTDTDDQTIDQLSLSGTTLEISLEDDGQAVQTLNLASIDTDTDDQTIDQLSLNGTTLEISLEDDGQPAQTLDLASIDTDTDDQTIDQLSLSGTTLEISLEDDGQVVQTLDLASINSTQSVIEDADGDTKVAVEESADEDIIRFTAGGIEHLNINSGRLNLPSTGGSVFIGNRAGESDDLSANFNVFVGRHAGLQNVSGGQNVYIGQGAGYHNKGSGNVLLGYNAGRSIYDDSNLLYIENSESSTPLIYGEFDNDLLRINGTLDVNNAYQFPTTDGTAEQILQTDGSGSISWGNKTTDTDNQTIDQLSLSGTTLQLSLEDDGQAVQTVDLSPINSVQSIIEDADADTKIELIEAAADEISFTIDGNERATLNTGGTLNVEGNIEFSFTNGPANKYKAIGNDLPLAMICARINSDGEPAQGSGVTYSSLVLPVPTVRQSEGVYYVEFDANIFSRTPMVTVTPFDDQGDNRYAVLRSVSTTGFTVEIRNNNGSLRDASFNFIAVGQR